MVGTRIPPAPCTKPRRLNLDARACTMVLGSAVSRLFVEECYPRLLSGIDNRQRNEWESRTVARRRIYFQCSAKDTRFFDINAINLEENEEYEI